MSTATKSTVTTRDYAVVKNTKFISVTQKGSAKTGSESRTLSATHTTFKLVAKLLSERKFAKAFALMDPAELVKEQTFGKVTVEKGNILYKGKVVHSSLTRRMLQMLDKGDNISKFMRFMDNMYKNPNPQSVENLYDFLEHSNIRITDDGCFLPFKSVNRNFTDCHTGKIDNSPGQRVMMPRSSVDANRMNECSYGYHVARWDYVSSFSGDTVLEVKVNPRDVVAVPKDYAFAKMRVCDYEVIRVIGEIGQKSSVKESDIEKLEEDTIVNIGGERQAILRQILAHSTTKRNIRKGHIAKTTIQKMTYARLAKMLEGLRKVTDAVKAMKNPTPVNPNGVLSNPMKNARMAAGLTMAQVAKHMDISAKALWNWEKKIDPTPEQTEEVLLAISEAVGDKNIKKSGISFPVPVKKVTFGKAKGGFTTPDVSWA